VRCDLAFRKRNRIARPVLPGQTALAGVIRMASAGGEFQPETGRCFGRNALLRERPERVIVRRRLFKGSADLKILLTVSCRDTSVWLANRSKCCPEKSLVTRSRRKSSCHFRSTRPCVRNGCHWACPPCL